MSKTYNSKHDFLKNQKKLVYPNGLHVEMPGYDIDIEPDGTYEGEDITYSTLSDHDNAQYTTVRHPNKRKKKGSLAREFTKTGMTGSRYWRNRYGKAQDKSSRQRLAKREKNQTRRNRLKNEAEEQINMALNDE